MKNDERDKGPSDDTGSDESNIDKTETTSGLTDSPYEMGETIIDEEMTPKIIPDDPIEAEQLESEKLRFGFSFEPQEGNLGEETEDEGDLTAEQRKPGNRYRSYMGLDDGEKNIDNIASDQELRVTDQGHIGMAFGEDNYVEDDGEEEK